MFEGQKKRITCQLHRQLFRPVAKTTCKERTVYLNKKTLALSAAAARTQNTRGPCCSSHPAKDCGYEPATTDEQRTGVWVPTDTPVAASQSCCSRQVLQFRHKQVQFLGLLAGGCGSPSSFSPSSSSSSSPAEGGTGRSVTQPNG